MHSLAEVFGAECLKWPRLRESLLHAVNPDDVHDLRVSIRRARTLLKAIITPHSSEVLAHDQALRDLFHLLGEVRDIDIAFAGICEFELEPLLEIQGRLLRMRRNATKHLQAELSQACVLDKAMDLQRAFAESDGAEPELSFENKIRDARRKVMESFNIVAKDADLGEVHRLRRRVKRLRYAVDQFEWRFGLTGDRFGDRMVVLQDRLGAVMDDIVTKRTLLSLGLTSGASVEECKFLVTKLDKRILIEESKLLRLKDRISGKGWRNLKNKMRAICDVLSSSAVQAPTAAGEEPAAGQVSASA